MSTSKPKLSKVLESVTGFEQEIIEHKFRKSFEAIGETWLARAAVFVVKRRDSSGIKWDDIYSMSLKEVMEFFEPEDDTAPDEVTPGE